MLSAISPRLRTQALRSHRTYATGSASPCTAYLAETHPDFTNPPPNSQVAQQLERFSQTTLGTYARPQVIFSHGKGLDLYAEVPAPAGEPSGTRRYLDFSAGIAVNSLGHADEQVAQILGEQAQQLVHSSNLYYNNWSGEMVSRLVGMTREHGGVGIAKGTALASGEEDLKAFISNSGTESNEAALKFVRKAARTRSGGDNQTGLVSFQHGFHGRTMGALSVTPNPKYQAPFQPLIGNTRVGTLNKTDDLATLIDGTTAGVIVEPIQGEGGVMPAQLEFLQALRRRCDEVGALLIYDEIQCGLFRTGTMWTHSELPLDAHPDLVTMAKPLANGVPIGAVIMRPAVANAITVGDHGTTFGGGPLACRVAHHVLGRLAAPALMSNVAEQSAHLFSRLDRIASLFDDLVQPSGPRGKGLLVGLPLKKAEHAGAVVALARQRGVLILSAGADTLRFVPSLTLTTAQVDEAMDVLESCLVVLRKSA